MTTLYQTDFSTDYAGSWGPDWTRLVGNSALNVLLGEAQASNGGTGNVMVAGPSSTDFDVTVTLTQVTNTDIIGPMARVVDASNFYYLDIGAFGNTLTFGKRVSGSFNDLVLQPFSYTQGTAYKLRLQVIGTACKGKAWLATDPEPDWLIDTTDSDITSSGQAGIFAFCPSIAPSLFDDFVATDGVSGTAYTLDVADSSSATDSTSGALASSKADSNFATGAQSSQFSLGMSDSASGGDTVAGQHGMVLSDNAATSEAVTVAFQFLAQDQSSATETRTFSTVIIKSGNATATDTFNFTPQIAPTLVLAARCRDGLIVAKCRDGILKGRAA